MSIMFRVPSAAALVLISMAASGCVQSVQPQQPAAKPSLAGLPVADADAYRGAKHAYPVPASLRKEMAGKDMDPKAPILVRIFKEERELEVWKKTRSGKYAHLKTYPICNYSGALGPKRKRNDKQAPEGFYTVRPGQMNPNSQYYLSFDVGYPNAFDRTHGRTGDSIMVHGGCLSAGCYAMTDVQMREIYALARDAFRGGQDSFQVQALPFRMTEVNMLRHAMNPNMPFWRTLKEGSDLFERTFAEPWVGVVRKQYAFAPVEAAPLTRMAQTTTETVAPSKPNAAMAILRRW